MATTRQFHIIRFLILASLAVSDILFLILVVLFRTISLGFGKWVFGTSYCKATPFLSSAFIYVTVLHLCAATYDTHQAIMQPLTYDRRITKRSFLRSVLLPWALPPAFVLPLAAIGIRIQYTPFISGCEMPWKLKHLETRMLFIGGSVVLFVIPLAIIATLQLRVYYEAKRHAALIQQEWCDPETRKKKFKNIRAAKDVAYITGAFLICFLPIWIGGFIRLGVPEDQYPDAVLLVSLWFTYASTVCNPIIYSFRKREFLKQMKRVLKRHAIFPPTATVVPLPFHCLSTSLRE